MKTTVGRPIQVGDVLSRGVNLIRKNPELMIPQAIVLVLSLATDAAGASTLSLIRIALSIVTIVVTIIVIGTYPSMVQAVLGGGKISVADSLGKAFHRFWTLLFAGILVGLIVALGLVALVIPGVIFITWYAYFVPAIMLEDKGVLAGMGASKAFGRDKKWSTFSIGIVLAIVNLVAYAIQSAIGLSSPLAGQVVYSFLEVPLEAWLGVCLAYTYIKYGPSSVPQTMEGMGYGMPASAPMEGQPPAVIPTSTTVPQKNFCRFCGSPIQVDSKFCSNCGSAL
ncbi:MAG: zinc-ribbon domain-containing protein [Thaumarchaeota archaeon]|nr:zinc-ribbon domain-containing protein [Nitrososphaerota archaeon]